MVTTEVSGGGMNWEIGTNIYSTGNCTQHSVMTYMGRKWRKEWMYAKICLIHFAVQKKPIQHCKATILQQKLT